MEALGSLISNNLNIVMKALTSITLVISVPTLIASLWGMNVGGIPLFDNPNGFLIMCLISLMLALIAVVMLWRRKMF